MSAVPRSLVVGQMPDHVITDINNLRSSFICITDTAGALEDHAVAAEPTRRLRRRRLSAGAALAHRRGRAALAPQLGHPHAALVAAGGAP